MPARADIVPFTVGARDPRVRRIVDEGAAMVRNCFSDIIQREVDRGKLANFIVPDNAADYLYTVHNGLSVLARSGGSDAQLDRVLSHAFSSLDAVRS